MQVSGIAGSMSTAVHMEPIKLWRSNSIFNLCFNPLDEVDEQIGRNLNRKEPETGERILKQKSGAMN
jgi:hypothetical protein